MSSNNMIAVIGAGISGLSTAYALMRSGHDVRVIDQRPGVGGFIQSEQTRGFLLEHGPNAMISPAPAAEALIDQTGLGPERIDRGEQVRHRYLVRDGHVCALAVDPLHFFSSRFFTIQGRLRLLVEPFIKSVADEETVAQFVSRRFGRELLDYVFDPLIGGLYAGDPGYLSVEAIFPHLKQLEREYGSVIRGVLAGGGSSDRAFSPRRRVIFSFHSGLGALTAALARELSGKLVLGTRLECVEPRSGGGFRLHLRRANHATTMTAGRVVLALPAYAAASALTPLDTVTGAALAAIPHPPIAVVFLAYERQAIAHALDGLGALAPKVENRRVLGFLFSSTLFAGRAPEGHVLLTAYVGGARQPELARLAPETLRELVHEEARDLLGAHCQPVFSRVRYWRNALPQLGLGHAARVAAVRALEERWPGLFVTGNYLNGVSTGACIESAMATASRVSGLPQCRRTFGWHLDQVPSGASPVLT